MLPAVVAHDVQGAHVFHAKCDVLHCQQRRPQFVLELTWDHWNVNLLLSSGSGWRLDIDRQMRP